MSRRPSSVRPVRSLAAAVLRVAPQLAPRAQKLMWRSFYEVASRGRRDLGTTMMNYGYAPVHAAESDRAPWEDRSARGDRFGLQLYAAVAGARDLSGQDVLEVGCGRGGGAAFVFEQFRPRSMTGLDLAKQAIQRSRARYARPGLEFVAGDAEHLPFADGCFDAVLNVESSHCYADLPRFLREVHRVLRPDGLLLLADLRLSVATAATADALFPQDDIGRLHRQLADAGFQTVEEEDITPNVVRALQLDTPDRRARLERRVPKFLQRHALTFAAVEGSLIYTACTDGTMTYRRFVLQRASESPRDPRRPVAAKH